MGAQGLQGTPGPKGDTGPAGLWTAIGQSVSGSNSAYALEVRNLSTAQTGDGIAATTGATTSTYAGVYGYAQTSACGTYGYSLSGYGARGDSVSNLGVFGSSVASTGVRGQSVSGYGVYGTSSSAFGVGGVSTSYSGVYGSSVAQPGVTGLSSNHYGIYGSSTGSYGVAGVGWYGVYGSGAVSYGLYSANSLYVVGSITKTGTVSFAVKHPEEPDKAIRYVCLEAGEVGTYCRGEGRLDQGAARVELPDHFRLVTDTEGITAQITLADDCNGIFVASVSNGHLEIRELGGGTSDARFYWTVMGFRAGFRDYNPIRSDPDLIRALDDPDGRTLGAPPPTIPPPPGAAPHTPDERPRQR